MLEIKNIIKKYDETILDDISYKFPSKGLFLITGESGIGKSTLLDIMSSRITDYKGDVIVQGKNLRTMTKKEEIYYKTNYISVIRQDNPFIDKLTLDENLSLIFDVSNIDYNKMLDEALEKFNLNRELLKHKPTEISGGQLKRFQFVVSYIKGAKIYFIDEAVASLDKKNKKIIIEIIEKLSKDFLVIAVTHHKDLFECSYTSLEIINHKLIYNNVIEDDSNTSFEIKELKKLSLKNFFKLVFQYSFDYVFKNVITIVMLTISIILSLATLSMLVLNNDVYYKRSGLATKSHLVSRNVDEDSIKKFGHYKLSLTSSELVSFESKEDRDLFENYTLSSYKELSVVKENNSLFNDTFNLVYGRNTLNEEEVLISTDYLKKIGKNIEDIDTLAIGYEGYAYYVVGVFEQSDDVKNLVEDFIQDVDSYKYISYIFHEEPINYYIDEYVFKSESLSKIETYLCSSNVSFSQDILNVFNYNSFKNNSIPLLLGILIMFMIFGVISLTSLIYNISNDNIIDTMKLYSIGVSKVIVQLIYNFGAIVSTLISIILGTLIYLFASNAVNDLFYELIDYKMFFIAYDNTLLTLLYVMVIFGFSLLVTKYKVKKSIHKR